MMHIRASKKPVAHSSPEKNSDLGRTRPPRANSISAINLVHEAITHGTPMVRPGQMAYLQRTLGNRQVGRLVSRLHPTTPAVIQTEQDKKQAAAKPPVPKLRVSGLISSKKIVRIAWTFDDGPTEIVTKKMEEATKGIPSTWYVMRSKIEAGDRTKNLSALKTKQDQGQEIAIHSMHPTQEHVAWFPDGLGSTKPSYQDITSAMKDLRDFHALLSKASIRVSFVRLPGGLVSELSNYLTKFGMANKDLKDLQKGVPEELRSRVARDIIAGRPASLITIDLKDLREEVRKLLKDLQGEAREKLRDQDARDVIARRPVPPATIDLKDLREESREKLRDRFARDIIAGRPMPPITINVTGGANIMRKDFEYMKSQLAAQGLHEWGGAGYGEPEIGAQSWEAESEPPGTGLTDNVIKKFKGIVDKAAQDGRSHSLVVLAHDIEPKRVIKVGQDIENMEKYAKDKGVRVEYFRMSDLFRTLREEKP